MKLTQPELTDNVLQEFIKHIRKDSDMQVLSAPSQNKLWKRIEHQNKHYDRRFVRLWVWSGSVAASICLLLVATWFKASSPKPDTVDYISIMQSFEAIDETPDKVQLVLSNNQRITIDGKETQLEYEEEGWVNINKNVKMPVSDNVSGEQVFNQLVVPVGKRSKLSFNDGTRIWVNSGSKIVYPVNFEKFKRELFVEGEIYIDVNPDPERPFIVHTKVIDVRALGTQFNVSAYTDQPDLQVTLVSGKVEIQHDGSSKEILKPSQLFSYNEQNHDFSITMVDVSDYIAWKEGYYTFCHQDLGTVLTKLSMYYDIQFKWNEKIRELSCSGKFDLKDNLQETLKTLEKTAPIKISKTSEREYTVIIKP